MRYITRLLPGLLLWMVLLMLPVQGVQAQIMTRGSFQSFEGGYLLWRSDSGIIRALYDDGSAEFFTSAQYASLPENPVTQPPPAGRVKPILGFGKVWGHNADVRDRLGWALNPENGYRMVWEEVTLVDGAFAHQVNFPDGRHVLLRDNNTWQFSSGDIIATVTPSPTRVPDSGTLTFTWQSAQVAFTYPADWSVRQKPERIVITTFDPANRPPTAAWTATTMEMELRHVTTDYTSLRPWADAAKSLLTGVDVIDRGQVTLPNGSPAIRFDLAGGAGLGITNYYALTGSQQIFISYTGSDESAARLMRTLRPLAGNPPVATPISSQTPPQVNRELAYQPFERGFTVYFHGDGHIWIFYENNTAAFFMAERYGGLSPNPITERPPGGLYRPVLGFGKVWGHFPDVRSRLGWATAPEDTYWSPVRYFEPDGGVFRAVFDLPDGRTVELSTGRGTYWQFID